MKNEIMVRPAVTSHMTPRMTRAVARQLHERLYGPEDHRGPRYYALQSARARRSYGHNPAPRRVARALWAVVGMACVMAETWRMRINRR